MVGNYTTCSMMTGKGLGKAIGGSMSMSWLGVAIMFFVVALAKKWVFEESLQSPFSLIIGLAGGYITYFATVTFACSPRFALILGLVASMIAGYFGGAMTNGEVY